MDADPPNIYVALKVFGGGIMVVATSYWPA